MPGVENWTDKPLQVIHNIIDRLPQGADEISDVKEYFSKQLKTEQSLAWVPSINSCPLHQVMSDSLVRYRCMVQDMFGPELYLARYRVCNKMTGEVVEHSGLYRDIASCGSDEEIILDDCGKVTKERQTLYCVPVPGEAPWVKDLYSKQSAVTATPFTPLSPNLRKRRREEDYRGTNQEDRCASGSGGFLEGTETRVGAVSAGQAACADGSASVGTAITAASPLPDLNFPLPGEQGLSCLVKVYSNDADLKVNDLVEVIGVLSMDPSMVDFSDDQEDPELEMNTAEKAAHRPPPSLVPRLHAILIQKLVHNNPLLPQSLDAQQQVIERIQSESTLLRTEIMSVLEHALCGDRLAAEFLLCHLISHVYAWADVMPLGKLAINLSGPITKQGLPHLLYQLIAALCTQSHILPISLNNMNSLRLSPSKDYEANRLKSGQLQLPAGTHLVLDETALDNGQLDVQGVKNVRDLGTLIQWQKVTYDFNYHTQDFQTDLAILVLSEGESFLPKDIYIPLHPVQEFSSLEDHYAELSSRLNDELLNKFRAYITVCKCVQYKITEDIQKALQEEFVTTRKDDPTAMSVNDFHRLLSLVRLLTLSHCQSECTPLILNQALAMENERKSRLSTPASAPAQ